MLRNTMIFDFQTKYSLKGIVTGSYGQLDIKKKFENYLKRLPDQGVKKCPDEIQKKFRSFLDYGKESG